MKIKSWMFSVIGIMSSLLISGIVVIMLYYFERWGLLIYVIVGSGGIACIAFLTGFGFAIGEGIEDWWKAK